MQKKYVGTLSHIIYKTNPKWINDHMNVRAKTIKFLDINIGQIFMIIDLAIDSHIEHRKHKQQKKK